MNLKRFKLYRFFLSNPFSHHLMSLISLYYQCSGISIKQPYICIPTLVDPCWVSHIISLSQVFFIYKMVTIGFVRIMQDNIYKTSGTKQCAMHSPSDYYQLHLNDKCLSCAFGKVGIVLGARDRYQGYWWDFIQIMYKANPQTIIQKNTVPVSQEHTILGAILCYSNSGKWVNLTLS